MNDDTDVKQLLHALGYCYGVHGDTRRALVLLLIAARLAPDDASLLRSLAHSFLIDGSPEGALGVLDRLQSIEGDGEPALALLRSRALWAAGRETEARNSFQEFLERRKSS